VLSWKGPSCLSTEDFFRSAICNFRAGCWVLDINLVCPLDVPLFFVFVSWSKKSLELSECLRNKLVLIDAGLLELYQVLWLLEQNTRLALPVTPAFIEGDLRAIELFPWCRDKRFLARFFIQPSKGLSILSSDMPSFLVELEPQILIFHEVHHISVCMTTTVVSVVTVNIFCLFKTKATDLVERLFIHS
jgi:hypothetical protein